MMFDTLDPVKYCAIVWLWRWFLDHEYLSAHYVLRSRGEYALRLMELGECP